jgi:hypothetical protein
LFLVVATAAVIAFAPSLSMPFFADDIDLLHRTGNYRAGNLSLGDYLAVNHNEHRMPVMRLMVLAATIPGQLDARAFHLAVLAVHIGCGMLVALMVLPAFGGTYALLAGAMFAASGAFSSMVVWAPTSAVFSLSLFFILLARHAIAGMPHPRIGIASVALLLAALSLNGSVVAVVPFSIAFWEKLGSTRARRLAVVTAWMIGAMLVFRWSSASFVAPAGGDAVAQLWPAARNGLFLLFSASVRWIRAWVWASPGTVPHVFELLGGSAVASLAVLTLPRDLRRQALALFASAGLIALAVGYGRREQPLSMLYWTDRYYYAFGAPFAVASVAVARVGIERVGRPWLAAALLPVVVAAGSIFTRHQIHPQVTADHIQAHSAAMVQARALVSLLRAEAASGPMRVRDGFIPLPGVHKNGMTLLAIVRGIAPRGVEGLEFVHAGAPTDDDRLNTVFRDWSRHTGWSDSPVLAESGRLTTVDSADVDFRKGPFDRQIGAGFHSWGLSVRSRWLSNRGSVTLPYDGQKSVVIEAHVPGRALRDAGILTASDRVSVRAGGVPIGALDFQHGDSVNQTFPLPQGMATSVEISFESSFTWYARQVYPNNLDPRELSITVVAVRLVD